jgi:hypothetical protein
LIGEQKLLRFDMFILAFLESIALASILINTCGLLSISEVPY